MKRTIVFAAVATALLPPSAFAAEPQTAFKVADGWVSLALTRGDQPVANAPVQVYAATGHRFADGETGATARSPRTGRC